MVRIFSVLYDRVMRWVQHPYATTFLASLSFAESSFFPVPPDVMLAPMSLAKPNRAWYYATITTIASVMGGLFGYLLGHFFFELIKPLLHHFGYWQDYLQIVHWTKIWGIWFMFVAGCAPIPYKLFTIGAGAVAMPILPFIIASLIGRGLRFFLVAGLMVWGGERMELLLRRYIDLIGWLILIFFVVSYITYKIITY